MSETRSREVTKVLAEVAAGDPSAFGRLLDHVYGHLRALAGSYLRNRRPGQTLDPTGLVHEAYLRLADRTSVGCQDRAHFYALCATVMRGILADHARRREAGKRGGGWQRIELTDVTTPSSDRDVDLLELDRALEHLSRLHERQAKIVEYRFFAGMTEEEVAHVLGVSRSTVAGEWKMARAWLSARLGRVESP